MKKQIISLQIDYDEDKVIVHLEADKERLKKLIEPLLLVGLQGAQTLKSPTPPPVPPVGEDENESKKNEPIFPPEDLAEMKGHA